MSSRAVRASSSRSKGKAKAGARGSRKAPPPGMLESLPVAPETLRRVSRLLFAAIMLVLAFAVIVAFRLPQMAGIAIGEAIGRVGFTVRHIEPKGFEHLDAMQVYKTAEDQLGQPMLLTDLTGTRQKLLKGWVKDARVSRRFPDTLVIDIVERRPAAIWQHNQKLTLIDAEGVVLEPVKLEAMPDLPLVIGPAANRHATALAGLLESTPELRPIIAGATWIGGRRWDIRFHSGEVLALPEGEPNARAALTRFAEMDRTTQLLGRGLVRFDMRIPGKLIVRVSREPGSIVPVVPDPPVPGTEPNTSDTI